MNSVQSNSKALWFSYLLLVMLIFPGLARAQKGKKPSAPPPGSAPSKAQQQPGGSSGPRKDGNTSPKKNGNTAPSEGRPRSFQPPIGANVTPNDQGTKYEVGGKQWQTDKSGKLKSFFQGDTTAEFRPNGKISSIHAGNMTITYGPHGEKTIVTAEKDGSRLVTTGKGSGYVEHPFIRNGQTYIQKTRIVNGNHPSYVYARYSYGGGYYYRYVPAYYYGRGFYGWAYNPWVVPVAWGWGWGAAPWYGYYGYYFAPDSIYAGPAAWLTDYIIAENLQEAYRTSDAHESEEARSEGTTVTIPGNQGWTHTGMFVNAGDEVRINATGGVAFSAGSEPQPPSGDPQRCLTAASGPNGWRASPFPDVHLRCWSLIGRIGDGTAFYVGNEKILHAPNSGELLLGVNDNVLGDNSGSWVASVNVPSAGPTGDRQKPSGSGGNQNAVVLTPKIKAAIVDEVNAQLAAEQTSSTTTSSSPAPAGAQVSAGNQLPAALDPKQRTFIVSTALAEQTGDVEQCLLNPGDILTRIDNAPDANQKVKALLVSSQKNDCASGSILAISLQELQDMHNDFRAKIDDGLGKLAENQGKNGMPKAPPAGRRDNPDGKVQPVLTAEADLQKQQADADKTEKEVQVVASDSVSN